MMKGNQNYAKLCYLQKARHYGHRAVRSLRQGPCSLHAPYGSCVVIDQLSEEIVLDNHIYACAMCAMPTCNSQVSGMTCRNGVKAWLLTKAKQFFPAKAA